MADPEDRAANAVIPRRPWRRHLPLIVLALATLLAALFLRDDISFETLRAHREALLAFRDAHYLWAMAGFLLAYLLIVLLSLPAAVTASVTGGFLFGLVPGVVLNVTAATVGAMVIFLAVRAGFAENLRRRIDGSEGRIRRVALALRENEVPVLLAMRLMPVMPFFMVNLLAALFGVAPSRFAWTTFVGIIPGGLVYTWVGVGLGEVFERDATPDLGIIFEAHIIGPILGLVVLALLPVALKPLFRRFRWR